MKRSLASTGVYFLVGECMKVAAESGCGTWEDVGCVICFGIEQRKTPRMRRRKSLIPSASEIDGREESMGATLPPPPSL